MPAKHVTAIYATRDFAMPEPTHYKKKRQPEKGRIILDDIDYWWSDRQIAEAAEMVKEGATIPEMAKRFHRDPDEVGLLIMHLGRQELI